MCQNRQQPSKVQLPGANAPVTAAGPFGSRKIMTTALETTDLAEVVRAAQQGDPQAWAELVNRFQDRAMAAALGWSGHWDVTADRAQEAFRLAYLHLGELREPAAFAVWFGRLVRTACSRAGRVRSVPVVALEEMVEPSPGPEHDLAQSLVAAEAVSAARSAVEALPQHERVVVTLFYLAEMTYPEIAEFLEISVPAAKKRALSARRRLKEMMEMASESLSSARPSAGGGLRDTVLLFSAIHRRDIPSVTALVTARPALATAREDWSPEEAARAGLGHSGQATALIRAAETGLVPMARALVAAGAPVDGLCHCEGGETPLWAAAIAGKTEMVRYLLDMGADPNVAAFRGATPLHAAVQRGRHDVVPLLLAAGADAERRDAGGRRPADWGRVRSGPGPVQRGEYAWTGIRVLDLLAPLRRGAIQWWPAAYGLGQYIMAAAVSAALAPAETWYIGFDQAHVDSHSIRHGLEECALGGRVHLAPRNLDPTGRRHYFGEAVRLLGQGSSQQVVVVCVVDAGHFHDVEVVLPGLAADARVQTVLVIEPFSGQYPSAKAHPPDGYHAQVVFDPRRAARRLYPAIDPLTTVARSFPSERHRRLAGAARSMLAEYDRFDPELLLPPPPARDGHQTGVAQAIIRYLAQPIKLGEPFTSEPAEVTPPAKLLDEIEEMGVAVRRRE